MINTFTVSGGYAVVGAHEDIDGCTKTVTLLSSRADEEAAELEMTPVVARRVARQLNKWARLIDPPKAKARSRRVSS